ncbi:DUF6223 family protein [Streptomyces nigra]|uniref:DUF6223 family protein n=1 Tax=Streptomyces nigra TaxID=1827580 RepID=UPI003711E7EB
MCAAVDCPAGGSAKRLPPPDDQPCHRPARSKTAAIATHQGGERHERSTCPGGGRRGRSRRRRAHGRQPGPRGRTDRRGHRLAVRGPHRRPYQHRNARTGALSALAVGVAGTALAVLHLATSSGGPGTGTGMVGAVAAIPLGLIAMFLGRRALSRSRHTGQGADPTGHERKLGPTP